MDDANVPSLLSLPYLGFLGLCQTLQLRLRVHPELSCCADKKDPAYVATRKLLLSRGNPYYSRGEQFFGVGGYVACR